MAGRAPDTALRQITPNWKKRLKKGGKEWLAVLPFIILGVAGTAVFVIYPMIKNIIISFQDYSIMPNAKNPFIGLDNYKFAFEDPNRKFYMAVKNTILNVIVTVPINWFLAIFFAVLINMKFVKNKLVWRTIYYLPIITSWIVVAFLFRFLFASGDNGLVNFILLKLHLIDKPISFLANYWSAMIVIWLFHIWKTVGWGVIIYLAALQGISKDYYEAAELDGANGIQQFWKITVPMLAPVTAFILINLINGAFNFFPQVYFITKGGPMDQTQTLPSLMFIQAFTNFKFGYAAALSVMMGMAIFLLTYTQMKKFGNQRFL
ncbi:carbohydrate ABC transporter permease [Gorillibacterium timonense]|uniref:carbohydrate ABC transporter permease n=1 Tax=Gorillibacterium timonense TaxID=1689269 RepID=UPI00071C75C7|nr:sugar ABC transporter permease [Gorillibacterium timonense]